MSILITGGSGKLGSELLKIYPNSYAPKHSEMDITDYRKVLKYIKKVNPKIIVHTAAATDIRKCELKKTNAWSVNVEGTQNIVEAIKKVDKNIYFVLISTACVFDGKHAPFFENDIPYPKNFYSLTKLASEMVSKESGIKNTLIIRTNFVKREPWPYPKAFTDRFGNYLFADSLALEIRKVINQKRKGVLHIVGPKKMSMYTLAKKVSPKVGKITLNEYKGPPLTVDMTLGSKKWKGPKSI